MFLRDKQTALYTSCIVILLLVAIFSVYGQVGSHAFISYDDDIYIIDNPRIRSGLTLGNIAWAFTTLHAANWHPLTWLSHMLDVQLFGMNPAGHHLMNVALHAANAILLFSVLCRLTGALWRSAAVAALFAFHPLHVESVAWVAERKDVLSTLFWMLTLYLYAGYVEQQKRSRYILVLIAFALGLMAKPMLVTLPLVMLLLDYWPLGRLEAWKQKDISKLSSKPETRSIWYLVREKIPFLALVAASSAVTIYAQQKGAAMTSLADSPLSDRIANALVSYLHYLVNMCWPRGLAVFYPFPDELPPWQPIAAAGMLAAITIAAVRERRRRPYLIVGWLWYICTLVPVIGIVRVGLQAMADRYTYIPLTGIFLMAVWFLSDFSAGLAHRRTVLAALAGIVLSACFFSTWRQVSYWQDTTTLASHALAVTRDNYIAHGILGRQLEKDGKLDEALQHFDEAVRIAPWHEYSKIHQGLILNNQGRVDAAIFKYNETILQNPTSVSGHINLGILLALQNKLEEAIYNFDIALKFDPQSAAAHYNMGLTLSRLGRLDAAVDHYYQALKSNPYDAACHNNLGIALATQGKLDEAIRHFSAALKLKPDFFDARNNLELALHKKKSDLSHMP